MNGRVATLNREVSKTWVAINGDPVWLKDGTFLLQSEKNGLLTMTGESLLPSEQA
jgi:hypothetical protein